MSEARAALIDYLSSRIQLHEIPSKMHLAPLAAKEGDAEEGVVDPCAVALEVLRYREQGDQKIEVIHGTTYVLPEGVRVPIDSLPDDARIRAEAQRRALQQRANIVIDSKGRVLKNRHGAVSAPPVPGNNPMVGDIDPLKPNPTLLDRLMLQHAIGYRICGMIDGEGFFLTVTIDFGCEGWAIVKHYEDAYYAATTGRPELDPTILGQDDHGNRVWIPMDLLRVPGYHVLDIENEREAMQIALDLADGRLAVQQIDAADASEEAPS